MNETEVSARAVVIVLGVSGAGKNAALGAFEDIGFSVINNLPAVLLVEAVGTMLKSASQSVAISVNAQQADFEVRFTSALTAIQAAHPGIAVSLLRLDADDATLTKRFVETRRKHPFAGSASTLQDAIAQERARISRVADSAFLIDTSATSAHVLRLRVREYARTLTKTDGEPTIVISSFAFRTGIPPDADLVFDARILPNPYYVDGLANLTGRDAPVAAFLEKQPETRTQLSALQAYVDIALPAFSKDNRARVHIAIGCTGGQHRSVYLAERIAERLSARWRVQRHDREHPKTEPV